MRTYEYLRMPETLRPQVLPGITLRPLSMSETIGAYAPMTRRWGVTAAPYER